MRPGAWPPDRPLVTAARLRSAQRLAAVDAAAFRLGLRPGLPLAQARAMLPDLDVVDADPDGDAAGLTRLAAWALRYSPLTAVDPPDGLWIDVTGASHLFGGEAAMLEDITTRLGRGGIAVRVAVADTPGAAHAVARFARAPVTIVPPGEAKAALVDLPVAALRLAPETVEALTALGFDRIGQLLGQPRGPLALRFGRALIRRLDQALGDASEPIDPALPPEVPRCHRRLAEPILTVPALQHLLEDLVADLRSVLVERGLGVRRLDLLLHLVDGTVRSVRVGTSRTTIEAAHLIRLFAEKLDGIDCGFGIEAATLAASGTEPLAPEQQRVALSGETPRPDLSLLVDRLANRLGNRRLYRLVPVESDIPERAVETAPVETAPVDAKMDATSWPASWPRPSRIFSPPEPVEVVALLPDHPPRAFTWRRRRHLVAHADGPERLFGEWWRDAAEAELVRDYFQVEDEEGQRFWLFRCGDGSNPATGSMRWYLHGLFG